MLGSQWVGVVRTSWPGPARGTPGRYLVREYPGGKGLPALAQDPPPVQVLGKPCPPGLCPPCRGSCESHCCQVNPPWPCHLPTSPSWVHLCLTCCSSPEATPPWPFLWAALRRKRQLRPKTSGCPWPALVWDRWGRSPDLWPEPIS